MKKTVLSVTLMLMGTALAADEVMQRAQSMFKPIPQAPTALEGIPITREKVALGTMLYFDPRLSQSHNISCNTCHHIGLGGVDMLSTSIGHRWQRGGRNAPTVLNAVFTRRSSGMAGRPTSGSKRGDPSRIRSRWGSPGSTRLRC
jgi:cytochrome c peroxidase